MKFLLCLLFSLTVISCQTDRAVPCQDYWTPDCSLPPETYETDDGNCNCINDASEACKSFCDILDGD
jgi:hypothetical protein